MTITEKRDNKMKRSSVHRHKRGDGVSIFGGCGLKVYKKRGCPWVYEYGHPQYETERGKSYFHKPPFPSVSVGLNLHTLVKKGFIAEVRTFTSRGFLKKISTCGLLWLITLDYNRGTGKNNPHQRVGNLIILFCDADAYTILLGSCVRLYSISFKVRYDSACCDAFGFQCIGNVLRTFLG